jgi:predicted permease
MDGIEPHWIALLWFAAFATICAIAFLVVAGMFPLRARPNSATAGIAPLLIVGNGLLLGTLVVGTGIYGYAELRWSSLVVVTGLIVLFSPGLFEAWPSSFRDRSGGLVLLVAVQLLALVALAKIAGPWWPNLS